MVSHAARYRPGDRKSDDDKSFDKLKLNNDENYQVWIDYEDTLLNVTTAPVGMTRPKRPLLNIFLNLSEVFNDEMYVGFTSARRKLVESHKILGWSFSNPDFSLSKKLITIGLPYFVLLRASIFKSKRVYCRIYNRYFLHYLSSCFVGSVFYSEEAKVSKGERGNRGLGIRIFAIQNDI